MEDKDFFENDLQWEQDVPAVELEKVKILLKKHDRKTVLKSVAILAALVLFIAFVVVPVTETLYWNPEMCHYEESRSDLQFTLSAWMELFYPGKRVTGLQYSKTGYSSYDLRIAVQDNGKETWEKVDATLELGELYLDADFYEIDPRDVFPFRQLYAYEKEAELETLQQLPEYITLRAAVTFPEELDMAQVFDFWLEHTWSEAPYPLHLDWVAVRCCDPEEHEKATGFCMDHYGPEVSSINTHYPEFYISALNPDGKYLEQHFKSLLQYSSDQWEKGRGMDVFVGINYYAEALQYVEENGVRSYGVIVSGTPQALLRLLEAGVVTQVRILDGWLDLE